MAASLDFPGNCSTNTVILQDFGEVAYIVCSVANPPSTTSAQPASSKNILAQLKQTETQFRKASILAALETDNSQLYTFYKKIDVMKDQRTLLSKFGTILRNNSCIIAYKAATKIGDLLKPENRKLYRLFVTAILANIDFHCRDDVLIAPLGQRYHVVENKPSGMAEELTLPPTWALVRSDLQVVHSGHVLFTLVTEPSRALFRVSDIHWQWKSMQKTQYGGLPVVIAPFGHLLVYRGGWIGSQSNPGNGLSSTEAGSLKIWRSIVTNWAKNNTFPPFKDEPEDLWVQLQLLRAAETTVDGQEPGSDSPQSSTPAKVEKLFWPAKMCFIFKSPGPATSLDRNIQDDPVKFVEDWVTSASVRLADIMKEDVSGSSDPDDAGLFDDDDVLFESSGLFQTFGPPTFPTSQTVYPTPPDVVMTHATPGMSSVDGMPMTPANGLRGSGDAPLSSSQDVAMAGADDVQAVAVGSGFYDEDLFEEMPDENFGQAGTAEEPNWDFFDKPDMELDHAEPTIKEDDLEQTPADAPTRSNDSYSKATVQDQQYESADSAKDSANPLYRVPKTVQDTESQADSCDPIGPLRYTASAQGKLTDISTSDVRGFSGRRRSSVYEAPQASLPSSQRDSRYRTQGQYWFDVNHHVARTEPSQSLPGWSRKTPSSSSASDASMSDEADSPGGDRGKSTVDREWTLYEHPSAQKDTVVETDTDAAVQQACAIFNLLSTKSTLLSLESHVQTPKRPNAGIPKDKPLLSLLFSQLIVDHFAQASLVHSSQPERIIDVDNKASVSIVPDLTNLNTSSTYATVHQLCSLESTSGEQAVQGSILSLPERRIKFKRGGKEISASTSIMPFWETLSLQPYASSKDLTAYCLHPTGSGLVEGCASFMDRVAEAYRNCNLGNYEIGRIEGATETGLLAFSLDRDKNSSLMAVAMRLGDALAKSPEISGIALIYIVGQSAEPNAYLQCCVAFYACFQAYKRLISARPTSLELVLQVIPASFVASNETVVVPAQSEYDRLALEVHGRIPPTDPSGPVGSFDYPIVLAEGSDTAFFSLKASNTSPFSQNGPSLHMAYSFSDDSRWLVACWSDETGLRAHTMTYLLKTSPNDKGRSEADIIQDMWEVSVDLMKKERGRWRLVVARTGFYDAEELICWAHLSDSKAGELCSMLMVAVEMEPSLQISMSASGGKGGPVQGTNQPNTNATPASTPQAITTSPEQMIPATPTPGGTSAMNAATPPDHAFDANVDGDLSLNDPTEESWIVILPFGASQSHQILELRPALASGYLNKRAGPKEEDGLVTLGVHLMVHGSSSPTEDVLEEIIRQFRGLVTLAVARGCIDRVRQVTPWHVHVALAGARALNGLM